MRDYGSSVYKRLESAVEKLYPEWAGFHLIYVNDVFATFSDIIRIVKEAGV